MFGIVCNLISLGICSLIVVILLVIYFLFIKSIWLRVLPELGTNALKDLFTINIKNMKDIT